MPYKDAKIICDLLIDTLILKESDRNVVMMLLTDSLKIIDNEIVLKSE